MERKIITIDEFGTVIAPKGAVKMTDIELIYLFEVYGNTLRRHIMEILKSGIVRPEYLSGGEVFRDMLLPRFYGLNMVIALAFRLNTSGARCIRQWTLSRISHPENHAPKILPNIPQGVVSST